MLGFINKVFVVAIWFVGLNVTNAVLLKGISVSDQECKVRLAITNINSDVTLFYTYIVTINKCSASCNEIKNQYAKLCVPDVVKDMNIKAFNLTLRTNETNVMMDLFGIQVPVNVNVINRVMLANT